MRNWRVTWIADGSYLRQATVYTDLYNIANALSQIGCWSPASVIKIEAVPEE